MPLDNSIGGAGATPGTYTVGPQSSTILVDSGGNVVDAVTISATESIYGVDFQFTVPRSAWNAAAGIVAAGAGGAGASTAALELGSQYAALIQAFGELAPVVAISYQRGINAQNLLIDQLVVTVTDPTGASSIDVVVPLDPNQESASNNLILATAAGITTVANAA